MRTLASLLVIAGLIGGLSMVPAAADETREEAVNESELLLDDADIVELLVFGTGPAVDENPELAKITGTNNPNHYQPSTEDVTVAADLLYAHIPGFHQRVTVPLQSGNPLRIRKALLIVRTALHDIVDSMGSGNNYSARGWFWHDANVAVEINGAAVLNAAVYANAALAAEVAWVLYVVPGAISYQFPLQQNSHAGRKYVTTLARSLTG